MGRVEGGRRRGGRQLVPGMALEVGKERELATSGRVIFPVASCSAPPPPLPVWALSIVEFSPQNLAGSPQGLSLSHLSINYRFVHESRTDDSHYLLGWVKIFFFETSCPLLNVYPSSGRWSFYQQWPIHQWIAPLFFNRMVLSWFPWPEWL